MTEGSSRRKNDGCAKPPYVVRGTLERTGAVCPAEWHHDRGRQRASDSGRTQLCGLPMRGPSDG
jgi:hypothetical protein